MAEIIFIHDQRPIKMQCNEDDIFKTIKEKFAQKVKIKSEHLYFLFNGKYIEPNEIIKDIFSNELKNKIEIKVLVFKYNDESVVKLNNNDNKISSDIICPKCGDICQIELKNYKFNFIGCKNGHIINDISFSDYRNYQKIDESKIICNSCNILNKAATTDNKFYICLNCKKYFCPICKSKDNKSHGIIDYDNKNYICLIHNEKFSSFCKNCKINLCIECEATHFDKANVFYFNNILPNNEKYKKNLTELKIKIDLFKEKMNEIRKTFDKIIINLETYYEINNNLFKNYENKNRNYQLLYNINILEQFNNYVINDINTVIKKHDFFEIINNSINFLNMFGIKFNGKNIQPIINHEKKEDIIIKNEDIIMTRSKSHDIREDEKLMCVCFMMEGENEIHCPIICKKKQIFNILEDKLYDKYPECRQTENYFICNGNVINKDKTMEENNIQNGSIIIMGITG